MYFGNLQRYDQLDDAGKIQTFLELSGKGDYENVTFEAPEAILQLERPRTSGGPVTFYVLVRQIKFTEPGGSGVTAVGWVGVEIDGRTLPATMKPILADSVCQMTQTERDPSDPGKVIDLGHVAGLIHVSFRYNGTAENAIVRLHDESDKDSNFDTCVTQSQLPCCEPSSYAPAPSCSPCYPRGRYSYHRCRPHRYYRRCR